MELGKSLYVLSAVKLWLLKKDAVFNKTPKSSKEWKLRNPYEQDNMDLDFPDTWLNSDFVY